MYYYFVAPADSALKTISLLIYGSDIELQIGQIVVVKIRNKTVSAFVIRPTKKPDFSVKKVESIYESLVLPHSSVEFFELANEYYPGTIGPMASLFIPNLPKRLNLNEINDVTNVVQNNNNKLASTKQQTQIVSDILTSDIQTQILHGDTGTGKTQIYFELTKHMNNKNKSVLIATPEISLTPQLSEQFIGSFDNVFVLHSRLTQSARTKIWLQILTSSKPVIVIGPRSILFAPIRNLGLIVIDEFHDNAYKQDQAPKYRAVKLAGILSRKHSAKLVLGSATPPIDDYFYATQVGSVVHRLTEKPTGASTKKTIEFIKINDKNELSKHTPLTKTAINALADNLQKHQQSMVFLNKRGTSRSIICENCGWYAKCERCNIPYTYHHDSHLLVCHTCNKKSPAPTSCPLCRYSSIIYKNPGTKAIETQLNSIFPEAKIARYDKDNVSSETFYTNYADIKSGKVDILVGTQLLTKGHDLPNLTLAIVLAGDSGLQFPDFSSNENNFQLIHQIIGRVGRSDKDSKVIIQTYKDPKGLSERFEQKNDTWQKFYESELIDRKNFDYPPYTYLLKIEVSRKNQNTAIDNLDKIAGEITAKFGSKVQIIGPGPALKENKNGLWNWQIIIKSKNRKVLTEIIKGLPSNCTYDLDPSNLL